MEWYRPVNSRAYSQRTNADTCTYSYSNPTPVPTPTADAADTYKALIPRTAQEIDKINALRHEYVNEWSKLNERDRSWYNDRDADFETQTIRSAGAEEIALLQNRIASIQGSLRLEDNENRVKRSNGIPIPTSTPTPTPPPLSPVGLSILVQDYNKMWEFTYAEYQFQSSVNRGAQRDGEIANGLVDQEFAFRASLKGLEQSNQIQKLTWRTKYFGNLHSQVLHNGRKLEEWEPHPPSGLERLDLSAKPTLAPAPTPTPAPTPHELRLPHLPLTLRLQTCGEKESTSSNKNTIRPGQPCPTRPAYNFTMEK